MGEENNPQIIANYQTKYNNFESKMVQGTEAPCFAWTLHGLLCGLCIKGQKLRCRNWQAAM